LRLNRGKGTSLKRDFLIILEEVLEGCHFFLELNQLVHAECRMERYRALERILGGHNVVQTDVEALLINKEVEDENGASISEMFQAHYLHLLCPIAQKIHMDAPPEKVLPTQSRSECWQGLVVGICVYYSSSNKVGAVGRHRYLQNLAIAAFVEYGKSALRL
jgi:ATP adenylyltransferase/5',5'''-P-1,P-4-tetraphosphate phosphorylase II